MQQFIAPGVLLTTNQRSDLLEFTTKLITLHPKLFPEEQQTPPPQTSQTNIQPQSQHSPTQPQKAPLRQFTDYTVDVLKKQLDVFNITYTGCNKGALVDKLVQHLLKHPTTPLKLPEFEQERKQHKTQEEQKRVQQQLEKQDEKELTDDLGTILKEDTQYSHPQKY